MQKILVVEDELDALELVSFNLKAAGYEVLTAVDGLEAIKKAKHSDPQLILLDLMLPEIDGLEVCKILRRDPVLEEVPIIMLTAKATEIDRILGLELGADDYITKPFSPRELLLRIKNLLGRKQSQSRKAEQLKIGDLLIDLPRHLVQVAQRRVDLTATEFKLLVTLVSRRGRVLTREQLLKDVWEYDVLIDSRTVDTHMRRLREKLGSASMSLETVRGVGYRFVDA